MTYLIEADQLVSTLAGQVLIASGIIGAVFAGSCWVSYLLLRRL